MTSNSPAGPALSLADARREFTAEVAFLNTATYGLPPRVASQAVRALESDRAAGRMTLDVLDEAVARSRTAFAELVGLPAHRVAIGSQVSQFVGRVVAALPAGATVVLADGDFTSLLFPFLIAAERGVRVRAVPLHEIANAVDATTDLVAVSVRRRMVCRQRHLGLPL